MNSPNASAVSKDALKPFAPGISWCVLPGDGMTLVYWVFEPPACGDVPLHQHDVAQGGVILEGAITMQYPDGATCTLRPGDLYTVRANAPHAATFPERCVLVDVFAPNRREYEERYAQGTATPTFIAK
jgi:quercetin dioxygenase-like cupin family protein